MRRTKLTVYAFIAIALAFIFRPGGGDVRREVAAFDDAGSSAECTRANEAFVNPNVGRGICTGTAGDAHIAVECSTMNVMDTLKMTYAPEISVAMHLFDPLVKLDADGAVVPAAAVRWESSDDGMVWTFHLRPGAKWVDCEGRVVRDVRASDFIFAWQQLLDPTVAAEYWHYASIFKNARAYYDYMSGVPGAPRVEWSEVGARAVDDLTIEIELETYIPYLLQYMQSMNLSPICEELYRRVGADAYGTSQETMCFNGPFVMTRWVEENTISAAKNEHWHDAASVQLATIDFVKYTDSNTRESAFRGGEVDLIDLSGEQRRSLESEQFQASSYAGGYSFYYLCNTLQLAPTPERPSARLSDMRSVHLRRAISAAIDRRGVISTVLKNDAQPAASFAFGLSGVSGPTFEAAVAASNGGAPLYAPTSDPDAARAHLELAMKELGYSEPSQIKIALMTNEGDGAQLFSQVVQEQLRRVLGIDAQIDVLTIAECRARRNALDFDIFMTGWGADYDDPVSDLELFVSDNGNNHSGWADAGYDELIARTRTERDALAREALFVEAEHTIARELPVIPVYWRMEDYAISEKIASGAVRRQFVNCYLPYVRLAR